MTARPLGVRMHALSLLLGCSLLASPLAKDLEPSDTGLGDSAVVPGEGQVVVDGRDRDQDGDGWTWPTDCNDFDDAVHPGAAEVWYDGRDQDCAGDSDYDADADGWATGDDCDDGSAATHPGATEVCRDGVDNGCDGVDDCALAEVLVLSDADVQSQFASAVDFVALSDVFAGGGRELVTAGSGELVIQLNESEAVRVGGLGTVTGLSAFADEGGAPTPGLLIANAVDTTMGNDAGVVWVLRDMVDGERDITEVATPIYAEVAQDGFGASSATALGPDGALWAAGAPGADDPGPSAGAVYVFGIDAVAAGDARMVVRGAASGDMIGGAVALADLDGDGAPELAALPEHGGDLLIFDGGLAGTLSAADADTRLSPGSVLDADYPKLAAGLDMTGDGLPDLAIGYRSDYGGAVYVAGLDSLRSVDRISSLPSRVGAETDGDELGTSVALCPDVDGDGSDDLLVGAPDRDGSGTDDGAALLVYGPVLANSSVAATRHSLLLSEASGSEAGASVTCRSAASSVDQLQFAVVDPAVASAYAFLEPTE